MVSNGHQSFSTLDGGSEGHHLSATVSRIILTLFIDQMAACSGLSTTSSITPSRKTPNIPPPTLPHAPLHYGQDQGKSDIQDEMQGLLAAKAPERVLPSEAMPNPAEATANAVVGHAPHPNNAASLKRAAAPSVQAPQAKVPQTANVPATESQLSNALQQSEVVTRALELVSQVNASLVMDPQFC